ncbi:hypothetical protein GCM10010441_58850 [Kitasatospora paracochleata]|uniref:HutD-family protein n=1 Tax=Kitasatospora paracochleata TaxID=58354 RepID=A0ABT1J4B0_9ACTN|nr:HutD family protein [Kitasatospora paracochleata]MCP2312262.1 hypothetical protein [Kitasatospora paracochleata]
MAVEVLRADERAATPWLNGGGVTREVAGFPAGAGLTDFAWRVSLADVGQGGPFSRFEGIDRVITVVDGAGMALTVDGVEHVLPAPYHPFAFAGDSDTDCRLLGGPVVDFNVMTRRGRAAATVEIAEAPRTVDVPADADAVVLVVCLAGSATLDGAGHDGVGLRLGRLDAALLSSGERQRLDVDGVAAVVELRTVGD